MRYQYWSWSFPQVISSSAYNVDVAMAARRQCFEGADTFLNSTDRGQDYAAGDLWGCVGLWYAGRWYTDSAKEYIAAVQQYYNDKIWLQSDFINFR